MSMLLKSAVLLIAAFLIGRGIGYLLTRQARKPAEKPKPRFLENEAPAVAPVQPPIEVEPVSLEPEPVALPATGTIVAKAPKAKTKPKPEPEVAAKTRARKAEAAPSVSPLAAMTPDQVEAAVAAAGVPVEPARLKTADKGKPDPLLDIVGIGPVNEVQLHALGIYHFRQIAAWTPENIKWVSERIKFPGRIVRENWMKQAAEFEAAKKG
ncbi:hypothetical protein ABI_27760 [Asticcacaulis biprosthecium C19]|uniref:Uncharacterized protein n=1 Tax=Asticcacaulis biprosthecium C19 TaxID=715226 RepID=F4QMC0_9CAUL|nr:hypothetical protein [Asticcacaulis biprosthecium]EGF91361.1 hypothetical protein ABI_27760 [Asticcacaulis biprosthecium C19]